VRHRLRRLAGLPLAAALLLPALPGCFIAAVGLGAVLISQEFMDHASIAYVKEEPTVVWAQTKRTLSELSLQVLEVDEDLTALEAKVEGARVIVQVQRFDATQTKISIGAKKWGFYDSDIAERVMVRIKQDLDR